MPEGFRMRAGSLLSRAGDALLRISKAVSGEGGAAPPAAPEASTLVAKGPGRNLYRTPSGDLYWLDAARYVDRCIIRTGVFEERATRAVRAIVRGGDVVLDVGANIGYYTILLSRLVGPGGKVVGFEPTRRYARVLRDTIEANRAGNVEVHEVGLSDAAGERVIEIGECSATLHPPDGKPLAARETIRLETLDGFAKRRPFERIDFIKVDIDGHEPLFLSGARETLERFDPVLMLEVNHLNFLEAGHTAWGFYERLKGEGYRIFREDDLGEILGREEFLVRCGNFAYSANVFVAKRGLPRGAGPGAEGAPGGR